ncbi:hypothetical protein NESM_000277900 [Novymonas esmeraldas]|uniref:Uncharacterized protein n=1 Tax=Novymonas esmeraldas TaxID=1808958 RepID=A0AAW0FER2_9TRYP
MDPEQYGSSAIKRYRIKREVEQLQQDGASLNLDRRSRAGRGFAHVAVPSNANGGGGGGGASQSATTATRQTSMFLDDE